MLVSLKMRYFRKHEELTVNFTDGLNTLKGENESGKTTILEAVRYALFGANYLRDTLAETVTWGHKESELSVELVVRSRDQVYQFNRAKSGAEVTGSDGTKITGQGKVTDFAAELLGCDVKVADLLMMASQSDLRGALDEGPTAVSGLMAKLSDFSTLDKLLERASQRLSLGSVAPLIQKINEAQDELNEASSVVLDLDKHQKEVDQLQQVREGISNIEASENAAYINVNLAFEELEKAKASNTRRADLAEQIKGITASLVKLKADLSACNETIGKAPDQESVDRLREEARVEADAAKRLLVYRAVSALKYPEVFWDEPRASFDAALVSARESLAALDAEYASVTSLITAAQSRKITNGKCPTCGHAARSDEHVAEHNRVIDAEVAGLKQKLLGVGASRANAKSQLSELESLLKASTTYLAQVQPHLAYVTLDDSVFPARASWSGEVPVAGSTAKAKELAEAEALRRAAAVASGRRDLTLENIQSQEKALSDAEARLNSMPVIDTEPLSRAHSEAYEIARGYADLLKASREGEKYLEASISTFLATKSALELRKSSAESRLAHYKDMVAKTEFNNVLVTKLKAMKPAITDHLWGLVLAAVSTFFSDMRGEQSTVTKDKDGFKVNGRSVDSLSGSTLDVLAVATRVALTKTFVPHVGFLVLDEPAHGCDNSRTGNLLGFLASAGFQQVILASHDDLSESVSDQVIALTN